MKNTHFLHTNWERIAFLLLLCINIANSYLINEGFDSQSVTYGYARIDEVKEKCASVLDSALELEPDDTRIYVIKEELSFVNGDWWQDSNNVAPIMPFNARDVSRNTSLDAPLSLKLASFWVTDVARLHQSKKYISLSGILLMGILQDGLFDHKPYEERPRFNIVQGQSQLTVTFQGIYTESNDDKGETVLCLLGDTFLPSRYSDSSDPWAWVRKSENRPPLLRDDQIILVIRYPKTFSLTSRAIRGSMRSLNPKSNRRYFDEVHISSRPRTSSHYEFSAQKGISETCSTSPSFIDNSEGSDIELYKRLGFCVILRRISSGDGLTIVPNWRCNGTDEFCSKLGPFLPSNRTNDGVFKDFKLILQDVQCEEETSENGKFPKVYTVFRIIDSLDNSYNSGRRTGLNNMTLTAEGEWNSTSGKLCMVGCMGFSNECNSRIVVHIPLMFSIKQRSIILGTISSSSSHYPLSFEMLVRLEDIWDQNIAVRPYYKYTKIDLAGAVMEKDDLLSFGTVIKKSFLKYPKVEKAEEFLIGLSNLAEDLTLQTSAYPDLTSLSHSLRIYVQFEITSLGPLFGRYWSQNDTIPNGEYIEKHHLLNVSAKLTHNRNPDNNITVLFLEGIYNEQVGKMYLIGCKDVRESWKVLKDRMDLEAGFDCLVEAVVSYPPTTTHWLVHPTASISISSQRDEDDPLYFKPIKLQTFSLMYRRQREDILLRRGVEGILHILMLSVAIACTLSQLFNTRDNLESVPFISLVMLGIQATGYGLTLIIGIQAVVKGMGSESYESQLYGLDKTQWSHAIDYILKLLSLVLFIMTIRISQKVWESRIRLLTRAPLEPHRVPSDKRVLFITSVMHIIGYLTVLVIHYVKSSHHALPTQNFEDFDGNSQKVWEWVTELEEYMGLVQDFFLLPQIIGNFMWQIESKPLRKSYFIGLTSVRILLHIYDFVKSPVTNHYLSENYEFANPRNDFYSKIGDVLIPLTEIVLAFIVYAQQRWKYEKLRETISVGNLKFLPLGSKVYKRLPSNSFEAELISGVTDGAAHVKEDDDSD